MIDGSGLRFNDDKINLSHIPAKVYYELINHVFINNSNLLYNVKFKQALFDLAAHCQIGAIKYPGTEFDNKLMPNWAKGQYFETNLNSLERHWESYVTGSFYDNENGIPHLLAVAWGFMTLAHFFAHYDEYKNCDNRTWATSNTFETIEVGDELVERVYTSLYELKVNKPGFTTFVCALNGLLDTLLIYSEHIHLIELDTTMTGFKERYNINGYG